MRNAQNNDVLESTTSYTTIWRDTDWKKVKRYVNKQRFRIFRAESEGDSRKVRDLRATGQGQVRQLIASLLYLISEIFDFNPSYGRIFSSKTLS